ncbi:hypothetical protein THAOC_15149 [Thalassiosira oceanica]|uniref:Uncharacterized protein n=1 Tax=Thalassiosira oceanica TaxID=159749 RepID=K0SFN0_THAOC|nr:hypothetical protein THAOC_15149 [Thalassiosira oceanica]|eukprot:EJK64145.1 hypothetical protein THAOC_15149 [Thalassiosira oceanica]
MDDSIYPGGPPPDFAGHLYHYHVVKYNGEGDASDDDAVYVLRYEGKKIKTESLRRWKGKLFGEDEDHDVEFWHQEMGIYLEEFSQHEGFFEGIETGESGVGTVGS